MNYLAIDTSGNQLTVIAEYNGKKNIFFQEDCGVNHSVSLMPQVEKCIGELGFNLKDADFIGCVVGAGSFTGIRIGVATVKAICFAFNKPCLAITSFDTIAYNKKDGKNLAVIDAGHNGYYVCGYNNLVVDLSPTYISGENLTELEKEYTLLSASEIKGFSTQILSVADGLYSACETKKDFYSADLLQPLYVRKSQAEEGRL